MFKHVLKNKINKLRVFPDLLIYKVKYFQTKLDRLLFGIIFPPTTTATGTILSTLPPPIALNVYYGKVFYTTDVCPA